MAKLLVIDDERSLREFLEILLVKEGHDVPETEPQLTFRHPSRAGSRGVVTLKYGP